MRTRPTVAALARDRRPRRARRACARRPDRDEDHAARRPVVHHVPRDRRLGPRRHRHVERQDRQDRPALRRHDRARPEGRSRAERERGLLDDDLRRQHGEARRPVVRAARRARGPARRAARFAGPRLLVGDVRLITLKGGPSNGTVIDYRVRAPQLTGRGVYSSIGSCGVQGSATFSASFTLVRCLHLRRSAREHDRRAVGDPGRRRERVRLRGGGHALQRRRERQPSRA